jgi:hypothetical protein
MDISLSLSLSPFSLFLSPSLLLSIFLPVALLFDWFLNFFWKMVRKIVKGRRYIHKNTRGLSLKFYRFFLLLLKLWTFFLAIIKRIAQQIVNERWTVFGVLEWTFWRRFWRICWDCNTYMCRVGEIVWAVFEFLSQNDEV